MKSRFNLVVISFFLLSKALVAQNHSRLVKVNLEGKSVLELQKSGIAFDHGYYLEGKSFIGDFSPEELEILANQGFKLEFNASQKIQERTRPMDCNELQEKTPYYQIPVNYAYGSMDGFLNLRELYDNLDLMQELYPNLITKKTKIANYSTEEGKPIYYFKISDNKNLNDAEPEVLYTALHHAREPASMSQMLFFMWYLLENYSSDASIKKLVDSRQLYFVPCVNPDGYAYNEETNPSGFGYWRKNRTKNNLGTGVDLNRNYGYQWGFNDIGSSGSGESETYRGEAAFSESESQAIRDLCIQKNFKIAINYHSFGNILIIPWGYSNSPSVDEKQFLSLAKEFTKYNDYVVGTAVSTLNYQVNGVSDDWMYGDTVSKNRIFAFTPEVGESFWPERSNIAVINQATQQINFSAAWNAGSVASMKEESPETIDPLSGQLKLLVTRTGLENKPIIIKCTSNFPNEIMIDNPQNFTLSPTEERIIDIQYHVVSSLSKDSKIVFSIELETGDYSEKLAVTKSYLGNPYWKDEVNNTNYWHSTNNNELSLTTEDFTSSPTCFTDSPNSKRLNNQSYIIVTNDAIDLKNAQYAFLTYKLKYDLEKGEDFAQISVSSDGSKYVPICGKHTVPGTFLQGIDQPVYDGLKNNWVCEWIDLKEYLGKDVNLQIKVGTGSNGSHDGFYIDDIKIYADLISQSSTESNIKFNIYPQPVRDEIILNDIESQCRNIKLLNSLGMIQANHFVKGDASWRCNVSNLPKGLYFIQIVDSNYRKTLSKVLIQ
ncbi:MAG: M14 family zinc carboxypeptidase [Saprospiraceae bacterium]